MEIKTKVNKWDLFKLKSSCTAKETISKVKRQPSERDKILTNETAGKGLTLKYTSCSCGSILEKQTTQSERAETLSIHFFKENVQMATKHTKRCSTLLIIRERQIKSTMSYQLTPVRMATMKKSTNKNCWRGCGD